MTEKQENILNIALRLFAKNGYDATSTNKIAKAAGVSEGLIFRHFDNKEGLLNAIVAIGMERANAYFETILSCTDPKEKIKRALSLPFSIAEEEHEFWKLMYTLKWQRGVFDSEGMDAYKASLAEAFAELNYQNPEAEARLIEVLLDGVATEILLKQQDPSDLLETLLIKYDLN
ncbi:MAG: helix-turn-helix domain-containing protein [Crocinitomicaceae bacterium]|nr:helix-turn-helix domain-containing protein [Crocinitomicaceae bacterium]